MPYLALVLSTLIWGATFPATKIALAEVGPFAFLFLRFVLGTALVFAWLLVMRGLLRGQAHVLRMSLVATVFLFLGYATQTVGLRDTTASNSAFITALYVILVPLFLRRFDRRTWLSAALALIGLWYLVDPAVTINRGDLWTLACAAAFAGHIACLESFSRQTNLPSLLAWQMLFVTVAMGPAMALETPDLARIAPTWTLGAALLVCGVLATGALALQIWAQRVVPAHRVALIFILEPVCAAVLAWIVLDEQLGLRGALGSALILAAILIGTLPRLPGLAEPVEPAPAR